MICVKEDYPSRRITQRAEKERELARAQNMNFKWVYKRASRVCKAGKSATIVYKQKLQLRNFSSLEWLHANARDYIKDEVGRI